MAPPSTSRTSHRQACARRQVPTISCRSRGRAARHELSRDEEDRRRGSSNRARTPHTVAAYHCLPRLGRRHSSFLQLVRDSSERDPSSTQPLDATDDRLRDGRRASEPNAARAFWAEARCWCSRPGRWVMKGVDGLGARRRGRGQRWRGERAPGARARLCVWCLGDDDARGRDAGRGGCR
jgi:hypothetical protein